MARLYTEMNTNRQQHRGIPAPHRLGDTWVEAAVQDWDYRLAIVLTATGSLEVVAKDLRSGRINVLYTGPIANTLKWHLKEAVADDFKPRPELEGILVTTE